MLLMCRWVWDHQEGAGLSSQRCQEAGKALGQKGVTEGAKEGEMMRYLGALYPQRHPFFRHINWDDLLARRVDPPFRPSLVSGGPIGLGAGGGPILDAP